MDETRTEHADLVDSNGQTVRLGRIRFASVELTANEDVFSAEGITRLPTTRYYVQGELVKEVTGGVKKMQQHQDTIEYCLQKQAELNLSKTLDKGKLLMVSLLAKEENPTTQSDLVQHI